MQLEIVTPEKIIYQGEIDEITLNTAEGEIGILPNHVNLFTQIIPGEMIMKVSNKEQYLAITGGFLEVSDNKVTIIADYAIHSENIDVEKALEAQKRAEEILKNKKEKINEEDFAVAQAELRRAILELNIAHRRRAANRNRSV